MKELKQYWSCTPQAGCYSIIVTCVLNRRERLTHIGFYGIPRVQYDVSGPIQRRLLRAEAFRKLTRSVLAAIRKEMANV